MVYKRRFSMEFQELLKSKIQFPDSRRFRSLFHQNLLRYFPVPENTSENLIFSYADGDITLPSPVQLSFQELPGYLFVYLYNAYLTLEHHDTVLTGKAGQALILPAKEAWKITIPAPHTHLYLCLLDGGCTRFLAETLCSPEIQFITVPASSCIPDCISYLLQHPVTEQLHTRILFSKKCTDILTDLYIARDCATPKSSQLPSYIKETKALFDEHYQENYTLDQLEMMFNKSKYSICREFTLYLGTSPLQYLNHRRIEEAKKLLLSTDMPVHEVGSRVGIENTNHFINLFKKNTGATPFAFKQAAPVAICELHYPCTPDDRPQ